MGIFTDRYKESAATPFGSYLDWTKAQGKKPEFYKPPKSGSGAIDIVPYVITSKNHPLVAKGKMKVGDKDYMLDVWVHQRVGPTSKDVVCPKLTYGKPCPICEWVADRLKSHGKEDPQYKQLKAKRRCTYNVLDAEAGNEKILVFEVAHFTFEKEVYDKAVYVGKKKGLDILDYADPEDGRTITFRTTTDKYEGRDAIRFKDFDFERRDPISAKLIEKAYPLDALLVVHTAEELTVLFFGSEDAEETEEDKDETPSREKSDEKDEEETPRHRRRSEEKDEEEETPRHRRKDSEEAEEETPRRRRHTESEDDEKKDEPAKDETPKCAFGHEFGVDCDESKDCDNCDIWKECSVATKKGKSK